MTMKSVTLTKFLTLSLTWLLTTTSNQYQAIKQKGLLRWGSSFFVLSLFVKK
jgi:hypothetical protein